VLEQLAERYRLVNVVLRARSQLSVLLERVVARFARHDDERNVFERRILLELVANGKPVHARKLDRQENEIRLVARRGHEARVAVVDDLRDETETT
jgi:hypothetical protein